MNGSGRVSSTEQASECGRLAPDEAWPIMGWQMQAPWHSLLPGPAWDQRGLLDVRRAKGQDPALSSPCLDSLASELSALITWPGNDPGFPHCSLCGLSDSKLPIQKRFQPAWESAGSAVWAPGAASFPFICWRRG